jgi:hypothetical protein
VKTAVAALVAVMVAAARVAARVAVARVAVVMAAATLEDAAGSVVLAALAVAGRRGPNRLQTSDCVHLAH